jgi:hypothetical protein
MLNRLFKEQGRTGEPARISAESIRRAERKRRQIPGGTPGKSGTE